MTISTGTRISYAGNGTTKVFVGTFWVQDEDSVGVSLFNTSTLGVDVQVLGTEYTVEVNTSNGMPTVTFVTAPPTGTNVHIYLTAPYNQETSFTDGNVLSGGDIEDGLDQLAGNVLGLVDEIGQCVRIPNSNPAATELPDAEDRVSSFLYFDTNGQPAVKTIDETVTLLAAGTALPSSSVDEYEYTDQGTGVSGTVARVVARVLDERVSIEDFGAIGDGLLGSAAVNAAAIHAAMASPRHIFVPPNKTFYTNKITIPSHNTTLEMRGKLVGVSGDYLIDTGTKTNFRLVRPNIAFGGSSGIVFRLPGQIEGGYMDLDALYPINLSQGADGSRIRDLVLDGSSLARCNAAVVCESSDLNDIYNVKFIDWFGFGIQFISAAASGHQLSQGNRAVACTHYSQLYTETIVASGGQTVFDFTLDIACPRYAVFDDGAMVVYTTDYTISDTPAGTANVNKRVTFGVGRTAGHTITLIGFRSLEAYNVNSRSLDTLIENAKVDGTGDSAVAMGDDNATTGAKRVKVLGLTARHTNYAAIAETDSDNTGGHYSEYDIRDCAMSRLAGADDIYSAGITLVGKDSFVGPGTIENVDTDNWMKYAIVYPGSTQIDSGTGLAPGAVITMPRCNESSFDRVLYMQQNSTSTLMEGVGLHGVEPVPYPGVPDLITVFTNFPTDTDWLTYSKSGATGWTQNATGIVGTKCATTVSGQYVEVALKSNFFDRGLMVVNWVAKAASGSSYVKPSLVVAATPVLGTGRTITNTARRNYKLRVPCVGIDAASSLKVRIGATSGTCDIDAISFSFYPYLTATT